MTKEERIALMVRGLPEGYIPRHCKLAAEVLGKLAVELEGRGYRYKDDIYWPYHLLVFSIGGRYTSLFCGGFRKDIGVQQLKRDGTADTRFKEESFRTPKGVVNYLYRRKR